MKTIKQGEVFKFGNNKYIIHIGYDDEISLMEAAQ